MKYKVGDKIKLNEYSIGYYDLHGLQNRDGYLIISNIRESTWDQQIIYGFIGEPGREATWRHIEENSELLYFPKPKEFKLR
jgi:hypothetical protein